MVMPPFVEIEVGDPLRCLALPNSKGDNLIAEEEIIEVTDDDIRRCVNDLLSKTEKLEMKVKEVSEFFSSKDQKAPKVALTFKENEKQGATINNNNNNNKEDNIGAVNKPVDGHSVVFPSKRMQELMRQFGTILRQISQHKWAGPFLDPVDVKGLGLHDYYKVIKKPMDLSTIRKKLEAKEGTFYRNVSDIYADTRLVFTNAMTYNDERNDIHVMAKFLLGKLEVKWLLLWPKVIEEENRQKEDEARTLANMHVAREAAIGKMASDTDSELNELNLQLEELREMVVQKCRKWSTEEKRKLGAGLSTLTAENLNKALEIIAESNSTYQAFGEVVEFDMDAQSEVTLWRLKFFVKEALKIQKKNCIERVECGVKRKKEMYDDLAKADNRRIKKFSST